MPPLDELSPNWRRRALVLNALRTGQRFRAAKLMEIAFEGRTPFALRGLIHRLRCEGYQIDCDGTGQMSRGYRLVSEPGSISRQAA